MPERTRAFVVRVLCALLALALGLPAVVQAAPTLAVAKGKAASCCCGTSACCAPRSPCCVKEDDRQAPEPEAARTAPSPQPRLFDSSSLLAPAASVRLTAAPRSLVVVSSPAEERLHLRQSVFRS